MNIYFLMAVGVVAVLVLGAVFKIRQMDQYKLSKEVDEADGTEKWFVKVRKGLSYYYLEQTHDAPGFIDDIFETSKHQVAGHETRALAEKIIYNHRATTVNGIEVEGE
jgi:hypothetical protein